MDRPMLSLAGLTLPGLSPPLLVEAAADAGFDGVGVNLNQLWRTVSGDSRWFRAELDSLAQALTGRGLHLSHGGHLLLGALERQSLGHITTAMRDLGVRHVVLVADPQATEARIDDDFAHVRDQLDGLPLLVEFAPYTGWRALEDALRFIEKHGQTRLELVLDVLHLMRSDSLSMWLGAPSWPVGLVQVCDAPMHPPQQDGLQMEARGNRLDVGEGALPLADIFRKVPRHIPIEVEAPCLALRNLSPQARAERSFRHLMAFLAAQGYPVHTFS